MRPLLRCQPGQRNPVGDAPQLAVAALALHSQHVEGGLLDDFELGHHDADRGADPAARRQAFFEVIDLGEGSTKSTPQQFNLGLEGSEPRLYLVHPSFLASQRGPAAVESEAVKGLVSSRAPSR